MGEFAGAGSQKNFYFVVAQRHHEIERLIAIQIVDGDRNGSSMHGIARPFLKFSVGSTEEYGHFIGPGTGQDHIGIRIAIEHPEGKRARLLTDIQFDLIVKGAIPVAQENRKGIAAHVGGHQIGKTVLIDVSRGHGRRVLTNFVAGKVIEEIWWGVRVLLGTAACRKQKTTNRCNHKIPRSKLPIAAYLSDRPPPFDPETSNVVIRLHEHAPLNQAFPPKRVCQYTDQRFLLAISPTAQRSSLTRGFPNQDLHKEHF